MGVARIVSNIGIGKVEGTFENLTTTGSDATQKSFTETMLDAEQVAAVLVGNNEVGYLTTTTPLFGIVQALSEEMRSTAPTQNARATVQVAGVAECQGTTGTVGVAVNRNRFVAAANGFAAMFTTTNIARCITTRGVVINVWDTDRVDILL